MRAVFHWLVLCALALFALQLFFVIRIASMAVIAPQSHRLPAL